METRTSTDAAPAPGKRAAAIQADLVATGAVLPTSVPVDVSPEVATAIATEMTAATGKRSPFGDVKLKYFGRELPPRCELHKCYLTDDGEHFYCTNMACNKHKYRRTKHTKYSRYEHLDPTKGHGTAPPRVRVAKENAPGVPEHGVWPLVHFRCPDCRSRDIDMRILDNKYVCKSCTYEWK